MVRKIKVTKNKISFEEEFEGMFEKKITKFGTGAKIDAPKAAHRKRCFSFY
jgi:putative transposon-encoded protein